MSKKYILAIESTCDETSIALIENNKIISNEVYSQIKLHSKYKGVVPEVASRAHSEKISLLIKKQALKLKNVNAVVFSRGPGLKGSLIIGLVAAKTLSEFLKVPLIGVNHLEGHFLSSEIKGNKIYKTIKFPALGLIVSGGHTEIWLVKDYGKYYLLGETKDDAAGEAFDKVAKLLNFAYPGGPEIEKYAKKIKETKLSFPVVDIKNSLDFSFSGLKTSVAYYLKDKKNINLKDKMEIAHSFQKSVVLSILKKVTQAYEKYKVKSLVVGGGVSANSFLRETLINNFKDIKVLFPEKKYAMDNAGMIAVCGLRRLEKRKYKNEIIVDSLLKIESWNKL